MKTDISVFHLVYNEETQTDEYEVTYFYNVSWQGGIGASFNKGYIEANDLDVKIFHKDNADLDNKKVYIGDIITKGIITKKIKSKSELDEAYNVNTIIPHKRGSIATNHIHIGAK